MGALEALRARIPDIARDVRLNLDTVMSGGPLSPAQRWGVAAAAAVAARNPVLRDAVVADARTEAGDAIVDDALAAGALMAMNNVYYRTRHMLGKDAYAERPPRLRMNRLGHPASSKANMELFSLAVSAVNGCEACLVMHEQAVIGGGLSEDQVHDAIRIAATIYAAAVALEMGEAAIARQAA